MRGLVSSLSTQAKSFSSSFGGVFAGLGAVGAIKLVTSSVIEQEKAESALRSALQSTGQEIDNNARRIIGMSSELQNLTTVGDETVQMLAAQAINYGLVGEEIDNTAKAALGLSRATGAAAEGVLRGLAKFKASRGEELGPLQRALPQLEGLSKKEIGAFISTKASQGFQQLTADADTLGGRISQLKNAFDDLLQNLRVGDILGNVVGLFRSLADTLNSLSPETQRFLGIILLATAALGAAGLVVGPLASGFSMLFSAVKIAGSALAVLPGILSTAFTVGLGPIGLLIAGAAALGAALFQLLVPGDTVREKFETIWEGVKSAWNAFADFASGIWERIKIEATLLWESVQVAWESFLEFASSFWDGIVTGAQGVSGWIQSNYPGIWEASRGAWQGFVDFVSGLWDRLLVEIQLLGDSITLWKDKVIFSFKSIPTVIVFVFESFREFGRWVIDNFPRIFTQTATIIVESFKLAGQAIVDFFAAIWAFLSDPSQGFRFDFSDTFAQLENLRKEASGFFDDLKLPKLDLTQVDPALLNKIKDQEDAIAARRESLLAKIKEERAKLEQAATGKEPEKPKKKEPDKFDFDLSGKAKSEFKPEFTGVLDFGKKIQLAILGDKKDNMVKKQEEGNAHLKDIKEFTKQMAGKPAGATVGA